MRKIKQVNTTNLVRRMIYSAYICIFAYSFSDALTNLLVNEVIDTFSLTGTKQGFMGSMVNIGLMAALIIAPLFQDKISKKTMLVFSCVIQAFNLILCGLSSYFWLFCFACIFLGAGAGLADTYSNSVVVDVGGENQMKYLGYLHGIFGVGSLLAPLIMQFMLNRINWQTSLFIIAALIILAGGVIAALTRRPVLDDVSELKKPDPIERKDITEYLKNRRNIALLITAVLCTVYQAGLLVWIVRYFTLRFGLSGLGKIAVSIYWVCATVNRFTVLRLKAKPLTLLSAGALFAAVLLAIGILSNNAIVLCIAVGGSGLSSGHFMPVIFKESAVEYKGKTMLPTSMMNIVMGFIRIFVPLAMAYVSNYLSEVGGMFIPIIAALLAGVAGLWSMYESKQKGI